MPVDPDALKVSPTGLGDSGAKYLRSVLNARREQHLESMLRRKGEEDEWRGRIAEIDDLLADLEPKPWAADPAAKRPEPTPISKDYPGGF